MNITVNGEDKKLDQQTLKELIEFLGVKEKVMAAAVNMQVVKKESWANHKLQEGDKVELLQFVGGG